MRSDMTNRRLDACRAAIDEFGRRFDKLEAACRAAIDEFGRRFDKLEADCDAAIEVRDDPPASEAQRRAMFAAKEGNSNLGIPKSVGAEFASADPGGKLPERKDSSTLESYFNNVRERGDKPKTVYAVRDPSGQIVDWSLSRSAAERSAERRSNSGRHEVELIRSDADDSAK